ncbi:diguanylate cyclase [Motiliproteus sp. MSK22-1]|uniref:diguanylate cyclase n=1 Tax=Motiliproteus sp. MSK22-1 TaxID=1897630 RepID=UPI0009758DB3|nr:diguanylate cyclase [Motiliproteus sp. MSK22-1]OMH38309.1 hypothetical protein BGP75_08680 [Motiliproteus sp. MSK22-1]
MVEPITKPKVLIVDDAAENIDVLISLLESAYQIAATKSGEKALQIAHKMQPDLILLDVLMPGLDGYQVCRQLKLHDDTKKIPIIFVSSLTDAIDETKAFSIGAVDYITKPFNSSVVRARVKTHVNLKLQSDMLEQLISIDSLTQIGNRKKLDEVLLSEWKRAYRDKKPISIVVIDIDHFKEYNDNYGHAFGDECLKQVARELSKGLVRPGDFVGRFGGDEFVAVLSSTDSNGAANISSQLRNRIDNLNIPHSFSPISTNMSISLGAATTFPHTETQTLPGLLQEADKMLYESKRKGRNRSSVAAG